MTSDWKYVREGFWIKLNVREDADSEYFLDRFEPETMRLINALLRPGDICFDIGANKGLFALHMAKRVGQIGSVFAFEPDSRFYDELKNNANRNNYMNIKTELVGVSDKSGKAQFSLSSQPGLSSVLPAKYAKPLVERVVEILLTSIDDYWAEKKPVLLEGQIMFVKIDVEGFEKKVVDGMKRTIKNWDSVLYMEVGAEGLEAAGTTPDSLINELKTLGYDLFILSLDKKSHGRHLQMRRFKTFEEEMKRSRYRGYFNVLALPSTKIVGERLKDFHEKSISSNRSIEFIQSV